MAQTEKAPPKPEWGGIWYVANYDWAGKRRPVSWFGWESSGRAAVNLGWVLVLVVFLFFGAFAFLPASSEDADSFSDFLIFAFMALYVGGYLIGSIAAGVGYRRGLTWTLPLTILTLCFCLLLPLTANPGWWIAGTYGCAFLAFGLHSGIVWITRPRPNEQVPLLNEEDAARAEALFDEFRRRLTTEHRHGPPQPRRRLYTRDDSSSR